MREWVVSASDAGLRLDKWLASRGGAGSRSRASRWLAGGKVFLGGQPVEGSGGARLLRRGDRIGVWIDRPGSAKSTDRMVRDARPLLRIVHEDTAIVVIDKPAGLLVEPLPKRSGEEATVFDLVRDRYRHEPRAGVYVIHRLDRDTSGLVLFARTRAAREALKSQFAGRQPERLYWAIVRGNPTPRAGLWRDVLAWDASSLRQRQAHGRDARARDALARYRVLESFSGAALVEVSLVTGKRNQIRVQAGLRGHPLLGERQYLFGAPEAPQRLPRIGRQALHAHALGFRHPVTGQPIRLSSPEPADFKEALAILRRDL